MKRHSFLLALAATLTVANGQWLNFPDAGIPRTKDGKANLSAPAPHTAGHPNLSGVWRTLPSSRAELASVLGPTFDALDSPGSEVAVLNQYYLNILAAYSDPKTSPMRPEAFQILRQRFAGPPDGSPETLCLPTGIPVADLYVTPFKIVQTPPLIVILYEEKGLPRQVYLDGRGLPKDPQPAWMGYSVGRWDGDVLVVESAGFNDRTWLDAFGHPHSEEMRVTERFLRRDFGHMETEITIDDPKMYTRLFSVKAQQILTPNNDLLESVCNENERDRVHMVK